MIAVLVLVLVAAAVSGAIARPLVRMRISRLQHRNHRGRMLPVVLGLALVAASAGVLVGSLGAAALAGEWDEDATRTAMVTMALVAVGLTGFADDLSTARAKGWRGHFAAAGRGRLTTGLLKVVGIGAASLAVAVVLLGGTTGSPWIAIPAATILIAGAANVWNGLDVAPGRASKWFLLAAIPLAWVVPRSPAWAALVVVIGAAVPLLLPDLRERAMLGDAGSNVLGVAIGAALVPTLDPGGLVMAAAAVVALNAVAETVTFTRVIGAVRPLRWFDRLGRRPAGPTFSQN